MNGVVGVLRCVIFAFNNVPTINYPTKHVVPLIHHPKIASKNGNSPKSKPQCYFTFSVQPRQQLLQIWDPSQSCEILSHYRIIPQLAGPVISVIPRLQVVSPIWSVTDLSQKLQLGGNPKAWQWHSFVPMSNKPRFRGRPEGIKTNLHFETQLLWHIYSCICITFVYLLNFQVVFHF